MSKDKSKNVELKTVPFDPRFPQANQTLNCFVNYVDYFRCLDLLKNEKKCAYFKNVYRVICPNAWVAKWDEQRENGTFPNKIIRVPDPCCTNKNKNKKKK